MSPRGIRIRRPFPTPGSVVAVAALAWGLFGMRLFRIDGDVGRHVRLGRHILETGRIPRIDHFSHTMNGQPFVPYEWLSEVAFALADRIAGLAGVAVLSSLLFASTVYVVYGLLRRLGIGPVLSGLTAGLSMALQAVHVLPRPHLFTTLLAAVFLLLLERYRADRSVSSLVALVPLMLVWTNLHGGFLVGFVLLGVYCFDAWRPGSDVESSRVPLALTAVACLLVSFLNPAGPAVWTHTLSYFGMDFLVDQTNEYRSPDFHQLHGKVFLAAILIGLALLGSGRSRAGGRDLILFLGWLAAGLMSARNIPLFGVLAAPWLGVWARNAVVAFRADTANQMASKFLDLEQRADAVETRIDGIVPAVVLSLGLVLLATRSGSERYRFDAEFFPVAAVEALDRLGVTGRVFNEMPWGGYLLYERPDVPVFIDGQTDFYGEALSIDYLRIRQLDAGSLDLLDRYEIDWALIPPTIPLSQALMLDRRWQLAFEDDVARVYTRVHHR